ncbi:transcription termination factor MTEF1, chloroplastic [Carica papaya]|uniref:transcription termination factor MTEF1, chloroplastic n=1 Tax=Carica papaya TaxID=3649 RepID=UPI000B8CEC21|nr:transcription termination factor MTEF1, chloroplastic [Carica papaya]
MSTTATGLYSSLNICPTKSSSSSSSSFSHSNSHQPNTLLAAKPKSLLQKNPLYVAVNSTVPSQIKEKILCLELMGVDSGKALALNPSLHSASLHSIESIVSFLQSKGIHQKDLPRIVGMCPQILTSNVKTELNPVFSFLSHDLKVPDYMFRKVIKKCPRLLTSSVEDQLKPTLFYLQRLGFKDLDSLAYNDAVLLVSSVEKTLIPKLKFLEGLGFSRKETVGMVLRCPALLTFSVENNFKPKLDYFVREMKGELEELKDFPQYFAFSLEKRIKPRYMEMVQSGLKVSLPLMLKSTRVEFQELMRRGT